MLSWRLVQIELWNYKLQASGLGSVVKLAFVTRRKNQGCSLVVIGHQLDVADDCGQQVSSIAEDSRCIELQVREMHMEMIVGRLVMEVCAHLRWVQSKLLLQCGQTVRFNVLQQWEMTWVEITNRFYGAIENQRRAVKRFYLTVPLQVLHQHESRARVRRVLEDDSINLAFVFEDVVHPFERKLTLLDERQSKFNERLWSLFEYVEVLNWVFVDVVLRCWINARDF